MTGFCSCHPVSGCTTCFSHNPPGTPRDPHAAMRMLVLYATFTVTLLYISCQMVAGIVAQSMSLVSDSSQGVVDVMTYAVSIYAQAYIDHSSDYRASDRIGVYSAFFGASTLLLTCFFLTLFALYDLLDDHAPDESPRALIMLLAGIANGFIDVVCISMMQQGADVDGIIPLLFGVHECESPAPTVAGAAAYGSTDKDSAALVDPSREGGSRRDDSDAKTLVEHAHDASMLNVGSSMAHLIVDLARSTVIICAAILIYLGYDGQLVDCVASLFVNACAAYMGTVLLLEAQRMARKLNESMLPCFR